MSEKSIRFLTSCDGYTGGDIATFPEDIANRYVKAVIHGNQRVARYATEADWREYLRQPAKQEELVKVRFLKSQPPYAVGEEASFPLERANMLVEFEVAERVGGAPVVKAPDAAPKHEALLDPRAKKALGIRG